MTCKHEFIGTPDGIKCLKCGLTMTAQEYAEMKNKPPKKTAGEGGKP